ncbi:MAG: DUF4252 domain-containing protein [Bacteroidota bacterium]|nr:DUF4252 domain-containing protein [Bacteroidota bacterium]
MNKIKYILVMAMVFFMACDMMAQKSSLNKLTKKYEKTEGFTFKEITAEDIDLDLSDDNARGIIYSLENLDVIRIIRTDEDNPKYIKSVALKEKVNKILKEEAYEQLILVRDGDEKLGVYIRKKENGNVTDVAVTVFDEDDLMLVYVRGDFDMSKVGGLKNLSYLESLKNGNCEDKSGMDNPQ